MFIFKKVFNILKYFSLQRLMVGQMCVKEVRLRRKARVEIPRTEVRDYILVLNLKIFKKQRLKQLKNFFSDRLLASAQGLDRPPPSVRGGVSPGNGKLFYITIFIIRFLNMFFSCYSGSSRSMTIRCSRSPLPRRRSCTSARAG